MLATLPPVILFGKRKAALVAVVGILTVLACTRNAHLPNYEILRTESPIKVDGVLDDSGWAKAQPVGEFVGNIDRSHSSYKTQAKLLYDEAFLYFSFRCQDENIWATLKQRDEHLWEEEVIEIFLQPDSSQPDYIELEVNALGGMLDAYLRDVRKPLHFESWNSEKLKWAVQVIGTVDGKSGDQEWTCEIALPMEDIATAPRLPPRPGDRWRLNLYRVERFPQPAELAWSPTRTRDFHVPSMFGEIVFMAKVVP